MNRETTILALEHEIHGIETELGNLIPEHSRLSRRIEALEDEKLALKYQLMRHKAMERAERRGQ